MENTLNGAKRGGFIYTATLLLFLAVSLLGQWILQLTGATETVYFAVSSLFSVSVLSVAVLFSTRGKPKMPYIGKFSYKFIAPALLLAFGMLFGLGFLNLLVAEGVKGLGGVVPNIEVPLSTPFRFILFTVLLCVFPAIVEELFFRGVLLYSLSKTGKIASVITVSLCFSLYHGNAAQLVYQFVYGVGLSVLALKAKSVIPSVIAHFINNFFVLSIEYFKIPLDLFNPFIIGLGAILLAGFAVIIWVFGDKTDKVKQCPKESILSFYLPFGAAGLIVAALVIVLSALPL